VTFVKDAETQNEEDRLRATYRQYSSADGTQGHMAAVVPIELENCPGYEKTCPYCNETTRRIRADHAIHEAQCAETYRENLPSQEQVAEALREKFPLAQEIFDKFQDIENMPTRQRAILGINECKRVLGIDAVIGVIFKNNDVRMGGLIMPGEAGELDQEFFELFRKSTLLRIVRVTENISREPMTGEYRYPFLADWAKQLKETGVGPIVEITPNSGTPRKGENGEACLYLSAINCWAEYDEPKDNDGAELSDAL
jgi:hypothetical protein